jgi:hypothetical protein
MFRDEDWMDQCVDATILDSVKESTLRASSSRNKLFFELSVPIFNEEFKYVTLKNSIRDFGESLLWLTDPDSSDYNPDLALKWARHLSKLAKDITHEVATRLPMQKYFGKSTDGKVWHYFENQIEKAASHGVIIRTSEQEAEMDPTPTAKHDPSFEKYEP